MRVEDIGELRTDDRGQTLAVLNPVARIDQHIMDDSDLAGPFLFCALFGTFLLLVSGHYLLMIVTSCSHSCSPESYGSATFVVSQSSEPSA